MAQFNFKLPDVGEGTAEAEISGWRVNIGDRVEEDQPLVDMMTEKATVELTSPVAGIVQSIAGKAGEMAAVGSVLVVLETFDNADAANSPEPTPLLAPAPSAPLEIPRPVPEPQNKTPASAIQRTAVRPAASPAVRRRAEELGIKLQFVRGSGPGGRIVQADLDAHLDGGAMTAGSAQSAYATRSGVEEVPVSGLRRQIAERMQLAKRQIPHFTYVEEIDVTELENLRAHLNATRAPGRPKLTLLPFFMRALVRVLPEFPQINATYDDEAGVVRRSAPVHIGMAVQTPKGLLVAVIKHAEARDVWDCASEVSRLATVAKDGKATRDELTGSTITLTSLGALGGVMATPVINRPEVAIIGPNKIMERPVVRDGRIVVRKMMNLSSSFDHRVVDGADAAEFIQRMRAVLEQPTTIFIGP